MKLYSRLSDKIDNIEGISDNGVYLLYHERFPSKVYIGSTCRSTDDKMCKLGMYGRWVEHESKFRNKEHSSKELQDVVNKYGIRGIRYKPLACCNDLDESEIRQLELDYITQYNSVEGGYNTVSREVPMSLEMRKMHSIRMSVNNPMYDSEVVRQVVNTRKYLYPPEKVMVFSKSGKHINTFDSVSEASEYLKRDESNVLRACTGDQKTTANHIVIYEKDFSKGYLKDKLKRANTRKSGWSQERIENHRKLKRKPIRVSKDGFIKEYKSMGEACKDLNLRPDGVSRCCSGVYKKTKGYRCEYV